MTFDYVGYIVLPLLIFFARILDVSLGTIRIMFISKNMKFLAPILGFFEVLIWILAINKIMIHATNFVFYIAYAGGFATGTLVGMLIEQKLSVGKVLIRIITHGDSKNLISELKKLESGVTIADGEGKKEKVKIIFSVIDRKNIPKIIEIINKTNPNAFYSVEDIRFAKDYVEKPRKRFFGFYKKGK